MIWNKKSENFLLNPKIPATLITRLPCKDPESTWNVLSINKNKFKACKKTQRINSFSYNFLLKEIPIFLSRNPLQISFNNSNSTHNKVQNKSKVNQIKFEFANKKDHLSTDRLNIWCLLTFISNVNKTFFFSLKLIW